MKVKKYNAPTMTDVMEKIRAELGNDAVILNSKVLYTGGFLGFFKKKSIEVIAAVDPEVKRTRLPKVKEKQRKVMPPQPLEMKPSIEATNMTSKQVSPFVQAEVLEEITEIKKIVKSLNTATKSNTFHEHIQKIIELATYHELDPETIDDLVFVLTEEMNKETLSYEQCYELTKAFLLSRLSMKASPPFQKKYINVVGPTGVGKTTTLAKLAAETAMKYGKKVAFITTDTYRIAAIEQLKTYATILNIPIEVAYNLEDFQKATNRFSHYDLVFIDTAGRNFRNQEYVKELNNIIHFDHEMETYLVLSLTSKQRDMEAIFKQFSLIPITHFIFTKMDETSSLGAIFNMMKKYHVNTAYVTNGQNVPDDILKATPTVIVQSILGDIDNGRSS